MPFLALSGKHGYNVNLNKVQHGIGINMRNLNRIELAKDGKTAKIGGGIVTKKLMHELWEIGKITSACLLYNFQPALPLTKYSAQPPDVVNAQVPLLRC